MDYTPEQLNSLIADVTEAFSVHLAKAEESFKKPKSEDESKKDEPKEKAAEEPKEEAKPMESEKPEDKGIKDQDQQKEGESPLPKEGQEEMAAQAQNPAADEGHGYDDEDMQHMEAMYASMSKPELKAHHDCIRKCMDSMGLAKCEENMAKAEMNDAAKDAEGYRPNGGPKDGESASAKTPASSDAQALNKSEKEVVVEVESEVSLLKSELEAVKAKSEEDKKNLEAAVQSFLTKFVEKTAPAGKAITSLDIIAKTENVENEKPLQKSEIDAKLTAKARDLSLSKSDREAINSYYCGSKNIEKVRHLLK